MKNQSVSSEDRKPTSGSKRTSGMLQRLERRKNIDEAARYVVEGLDCRGVKSGKSGSVEKSKR